MAHMGAVRVPLLKVCCCCCLAEHQAHSHPRHQNHYDLCIPTRSFWTPSPMKKSFLQSMNQKEWRPHRHNQGRVTDRPQPHCPHLYHKVHSFSCSVSTSTAIPATCPAHWDSRDSAMHQSGPHPQGAYIPVEEDRQHINNTLGGSSKCYEEKILIKNMSECVIFK